MRANRPGLQVLRRGRLGGFFEAWKGDGDGDAKIVFKGGSGTAVLLGKGELGYPDEIPGVGYGRYWRLRRW